MSVLCRLIPAIFVVCLFGAAAESSAETLSVSCDVNEMAPTYGYTLCQDAPIVYDDQYFVLKGSQFTNNISWHVTRAYLQATELSAGHYRQREIPMGLFVTSLNSGYATDNIVQPDGTFNMIVHLQSSGSWPLNLPRQYGLQNLFVDITPPSTMLPVPPRKTVTVSIDLREGPPQKKIKQEKFSCDGPPDPVLSKTIEQKNLATPNPEIKAYCYAGGLFSFEGGPYQQLRAGINIGSSGADKLVLRPQDRPNDGQRYGMSNLVPVGLNPRGDQILHFKYGDWHLPNNPALLPGSVWKLTVFDDHDEKNIFVRDIGLIQIAPSPKTDFGRTGKLSYPLTELRAGGTTDFLRPDPKRIYQGSILQANVPLAAFSPCSRRNVTGDACEGSTWLSLTSDKDRYCTAYMGSQQVEATLNFHGNGTSHVLAVKVPKDMKPGSYQVRLSCPDMTGRGLYIDEVGWRNPFDADSAKVKVSVEPPRKVPTVTIVPLVAPPVLAGARRELQDNTCAPCNGENYRIDIDALKTDDAVQLIQWNDAERWPDQGVVARGKPVGKIPFSLSAKIPVMADQRLSDEHSLTIQLKDAQGHVYPVPGSDIKSKPMASYPKGDARWRFYKICETLNPKQPPKIGSITNPVDLFSTFTANIRYENFDCLAAIPVRVEIPAIHIDQQIIAGPTSVTDDGNMTIDFSILGTSLLNDVKEPTPVRLTFAMLDKNRSSSTISTILLPRIAIKVRTKPASAGQRIEIEWKGFKPNQSANLLLDNRQLNSRPLLLDGVQPVVTVLLPDGMTGPHKLTLTDASGNTASTSIDISAGTGNGAKPVDDQPKAVCDKPCIMVQKNAKQGDTIPIRFAAFPHLAPVKFTLQGKWVIKSSEYQKGLVDTIDYKIPESLPDGDYEVIGENGQGADKVSAKGVVHIAGKRQEPTLEARPVKPDDTEVRYRIGLNKVQLHGLRWTLGTEFTASLIGITNDGGNIDLKRIYTLAGPPLDGCLGAGAGLFLNNCDQRNGEIIQFWPLDGNIRPGSYVLKLSDGISNTTTQPFVVVATQDDVQIANAKGKLNKADAFAGDTLTFTGENFPAGARVQALFDGQALTAQAQADTAGKVRALAIPIAANVGSGPHEVAIRTIGETRAQAQQPAMLSYAVTIKERAPADQKTNPVPIPKPCNPELPKSWQLGCLAKDGNSNQGNKPAPQPDPKPVPQPATDGKPCNSELPKSWQPGCVDGGQKTVPQPAQRSACDPNVPKMYQPNCIEKEVPKQEPASMQRCNPGVPRYTQPNCVP